MKLILTSLLFIMMLGLARAQAERIIYENFKLKSDEISFDLPGEIEVKYWKKDHIRILIVINTENCNLETLNNLVDTGRYQLNLTLSEGLTLVTLPLVKEKIKLIDENLLLENFKFEIRLPEGIVQKNYNN
jgi:hypothetical protein